MRGKNLGRCLPLGVALCASSAFAGTYHFVPNPANLDNLDHYYYYSWGINWTLPKNEVITEATLTIHNIYDWTEEEGDALYVHLLDHPPLGFHSYYDNMEGGDAWAGTALVGVFSDPGGGHPRSYDLVYNFSDAGLVGTLNNYVQDGRFGLGFDPDCHYNNDGAELIIKTQTVPEPASLAGLFIGLVGIARRRNRR